MPRGVAIGNYIMLGRTCQSIKQNFFLNIGEGGGGEGIV